MSLHSGSRIGSFEILARIGAGGMGEVYRARDSKLDRQVAIKILPDAVAHNPERMARFEREAKVLASLNHPGIAQIYGFEDGALVMELVEGEILKGPLPLDRALDYARQIADALEAAHEKGITHRDLKPANIMITTAGAIKVLDFGLAAVSQDPGAAANPDDSPTFTTAATQPGVIMGTAAYMSPEQASGKPVDKRADIWAFGVVLAETVTGKRLFSGETISHTLANVLAKEPDLRSLPAPVRPIVEKCLRKDPRRRWRDIGDVRMALDEPVMEPVPSRARSRAWLGLAGVAALGIVLALGVVWRTNQQSSAIQPLRQLDLDVGPDAVSQPVISPDGSLVVFVSKNQLVMRELDKAIMTPLAGTEGAIFPFFSPDGRFVAFFASGKLKRIDVRGGIPQIICDAPQPRGGSWGEDGSIVVALSGLSGLSRVSASPGAAPAALTSTDSDPEGMGSHRWPQVLPNGKGILYAATTGLRGSLRVLGPDGKSETLVANSTYGRYLPSGHLIYYQGGALLAAPMDLDQMEPGPASPLVEGVAYTPNIANADFDISPAGTLVYVRGIGGAKRSVSWLDSMGKVTPLLAKPAVYLYPKLSPDGNRLGLVTAEEDGKTTVSVYDMALESLTSIVTGPENKAYLAWTPDGEFIVFGARGLNWIRADGSGKLEQADAGSNASQELSSTAGPLVPAISGDGKRFVYSGRGGIRTLSLERTSTGIRLGQPAPPFQAGTAPSLSPDGRFVAYHTPPSGSGPSQIFVVPISTPAEAAQPSRTAKWQVSNEGGMFPVWPRNSQEIFYIGPDRRIWAARYTIADDSFKPEKARVWSERVLANLGSNPLFDMDSQGKRAAVLIDAESEVPKPETHIHVMLNLGDELRRRSADSGK